MAFPDSSKKAPNVFVEVTDSTGTVTSTSLSRISTTSVINVVPQPSPPVTTFSSFSSIQPTTWESLGDSTDTYLTSEVITYGYSPGFANYVSTYGNYNLYVNYYNPPIQFNAFNSVESSTWESLGDTTNIFTSSEVITNGITPGYLDYNIEYGVFDLYVNYYNPPIQFNAFNSVESSTWSSLGSTSTTFSTNEVITYGVTSGYLDYQSTYGTYDLYVNYYETPPIVTYEFLDNFDGVGTMETHTPDIGGAWSNNYYSGSNPRNQVANWSVGSGYTYQSLAASGGIANYNGPTSPLSQLTMILEFEIATPSYSASQFDQTVSIEMIDSVGNGAGIFVTGGYNSTGNIRVSFSAYNSSWDGNYQTVTLPGAFVFDTVHALTAIMTSSTNVDFYFNTTLVGSITIPSGMNSTTLPLFDIAGAASITGPISPISTSRYHKVWIREGAYPPV